MGTGLKPCDRVGRPARQTRVRHARIFSCRDDPRRCLALSGELANLIDELIIRGCGLERLDPLVLPEFDLYWRITLDFLNIAIAQWPVILAKRGLVDRARRQVALIEAQSRRLRDGAMTGPVIAIGSTGTNRATARLLAAIARAPRGAVVLPGLIRTSTLSPGH